MPQYIDGDGIYEIALGAGQGLTIKYWSDGSVKVGVTEDNIIDGIEMPPKFIILGSGKTTEDAIKNLLKNDEAVAIGISHEVPICLQRALDVRRGHPRGRVTQTKNGQTIIGYNDQRGGVYVMGDNSMPHFVKEMI